MLLADAPPDCADPSRRSLEYLREGDTGCPDDPRVAAILLVAAGGVAALVGLAFPSLVRRATGRTPGEQSGPGSQDRSRRTVGGMSMPMHPSGGPHFDPEGREPEQPEPQRKERLLLAIAGIGMVAMIVVVLVFVLG